jgi:hypothetical protein
MVKLLATRALSKVHSPTDAVCNFNTFGRFFFFQIIWCMLCLIITDLTVHVNLLFQLDRNEMSFFTSQQFLIKPNNGAHHNPNFVAKKSTQPNRITSSFPPAHSLTHSFSLPFTQSRLVLTFRMISNRCDNKLLFKQLRPHSPYDCLTADTLITSLMSKTNSFISRYRFLKCLHLS